MRKDLFAALVLVAFVALVAATHTRGDGPILLAQASIFYVGTKAYTLCRYEDGVTLTLDGAVPCPLRFR